MSTINNTPSVSRNLTDRLQDYLLTKRHITPAEYRVVFGAERLAPRILELRNRGFRIGTSTHEDFSGQRYTRYTLLFNQPASACAA